MTTPRYQWYVTVTYPLEKHPLYEKLIRSKGRKPPTFEAQIPFDPWPGCLVRLDFWFKTERGAVNFYSRVKRGVRRQDMNLELPMESVIRV